MEEESRLEQGEQHNASIEEIIEACRGVLPDEDLEDLRVMDPEEAYIYLLSYLPEFDIEDPDAFLVEKGLVLGSRPLNEEELSRHQGEYRADEIDYK